MSLYLYTNKDEISPNIPLILGNNTYFNKVGVIPDTELVRKVLAEIEKAEYVSADMFRERSVLKILLDKTKLSGSTKALLNVLNNSNLCFNIQSCGRNILPFIFQLPVGHVYWGKPIVPIVGDWKCDVIFQGKHFTQSQDLRESITDYGDTISLE